MKITPTIYHFEIRNKRPHEIELIMISRTATNFVTVTSTEVHSLPELCSRVAHLANSSFLKEGICVHAPIIKLGLQHDLYLNNNLLSLYRKCFGVRTVRKLFDEMPHRDVVSFTGLLSAYVKIEQHEEALNLFHSMAILGPAPNAFTFANVLRCCSSLGDFEYGRRVHARIIKNGLGWNPVLVSALIDFYSNCDDVEEACKVFGCVKVGDVVSWTMMVSFLAQAGKWGRALQLYIDMVKSGVAPNGFTFVKVLAACGFLGLKYGKSVHAHMVVLGVELNLVVKTALVDMYSRCERMEDAIKVLKLTPERDVVLWSVVISGLAKNSKLKEAVGALREMEMSGISPCSVTFLSILNACSVVKLLDLGRQTHSRVIVAGLEEDVPVGNALVHMYMKCSETVEDGFRSFRAIKSPNVVSWTSLIAGLSDHGFQQDSLNSYIEMRAARVEPNSYTLSTILRACSVMKCASETTKLHGYIIKTEAHHDTVVCNALVDAYAGSGRVDDAWHVLRNTSNRDAIMYTSLATRLNQAGQHELALRIINQMFDDDDVKMDAFTLASFLSASASLGAMETGQQLHCHSVKSGLGNHISVLNALVDYYGKLGLLHEARRAFMEISEPNAVSWNALISGLASIGQISSALSAFDEMRMSGAKPDSLTLLVVLFTCCHGGLVDMGLEYFNSMRETHGIEPQLNHYISLVDLLGKAGRLEEALGVIESMPFKPNSLIYKTMLVSCKLHRNVPLGEEMARRGLELDPSDDIFYQLLANLYHNAGLSDLGKNAHRLIKEKR